LNSLNDHEIEDIEVKLKVEWCPLNEIPVELYDFGQGKNAKEIEKKKTEEKIEETNLKVEENFNPALPEFENGSMIKYTCRYEIQIENEREFQVCRKIIGPKGSNMKQIIEYCCQDKHEDYQYYQEQIKLRLRGTGSGYKEGINQLGMLLTFLFIFFLMKFFFFVFSNGSLLFSIFFYPKNIFFITHILNV